MLRAGLVCPVDGTSRIVDLSVMVASRGAGGKSGSRVNGGESGNGALTKSASESGTYGG